MPPEAYTLLQEIRDRLERIEDLLLGDGQEGLLREVAKNTDFRLNYMRYYRAIWVTVIGAVVTALAGLAAALVG